MVSYRKFLIYHPRPGIVKEKFLGKRRRKKGGRQGPPPI